MNQREELAERFLSSFRKIMYCVRSTFGREMAEYGVTWPQFHVLKTVAQSGHVNVTDISDRMMTSSPTASRMIDSLCKKKLLEKRRGETDRRVTILVLTGKGKTLMDRIGAVQRERLVGVLGEEDDAELEKMVSRLEKISDSWLNLIQESIDKGSNG
ncbi:MAG: MarR family transcriptional regulator [Actinobacteria bacterium]|nr:MarR family transcriptional regulator [Actinomycetota bacterium]